MGVDTHMLANRLRMAQGGLSLCDKSLREALQLIKDCDKVSDIHGADDQDRTGQTELEFYGDLLQSGEF